MLDAKQLIGQIMGTGSEGSTGKGSGTAGIAGGALAGGLVGLMAGTKSGRKIGKKALTYGGTALLGGLAYKAWRDWQSGKKPDVAPTDRELPEPPMDSAFVPDAGDEANFNRTLLAAMIGAAKADGRIDDLERRRILQHLDRQGVADSDRTFVEAQLNLPLDLEPIVAGASCPERAAEIYAASLIAIDPNRPAEKGYLAMLSARLGLDPALVSHLHAGVEAAKAESQ